MEIQNQTDAEILQVAEAMYSEIVNGSNANDWERFSQFLDIRTPDVKKSVLEQWKNTPVLTSLTQQREFLSVLRREDHVLVTWKQWSTKVKGEYLALLYLRTIEDEVKSIGIFIK